MRSAAECSGGAKPINAVRWLEYRLMVNGHTVTQLVNLFPLAACVRKHHHMVEGERKHQEQRIRLKILKREWKKKSMGRNIIMVKWEIEQREFKTWTNEDIHTHTHVDYNPISKGSWNSSVWLLPYKLRIILLIWMSPLIVCFPF